MNEHHTPPGETANPDAGFQSLARETLRHAGGRRSIGNHVRQLHAAISLLRADGVSWKWIAEQIRLARSDDDTNSYAGTIRAAYSRAGLADMDNFAAASGSADFCEQVQATLNHVAGRRSLSDQVRRLAPAIAAARADGVSWLWLAEVVGKARNHSGDVSDFAVQLRSLYHRLKSPPATPPRPSATTGSSPVRVDELPHGGPIPPHVAAVAPPAPAAGTPPHLKNATGRIRARSKNLSLF